VETQGTIPPWWSVVFVIEVMELRSDNKFEQLTEHRASMATVLIALSVDMVFVQALYPNGAFQAVFLFLAGL
jgi:hypothetical protein